MSREVTGTAAPAAGDPDGDPDGTPDGDPDGDLGAAAGPAGMRARAARARRAAPGHPSAPRPVPAAARPLLLALAGVIALAALAWALVAPPETGRTPAATVRTPSGPSAAPAPQPAGADDPAPSPLAVNVLPAVGRAAGRTTLERLPVRVQVLNTGPAVRLEQLTVTGLGSLLADRADQPLTVSGQGATTVEAMLLPDCAARRRDVPVSASAVTVLPGGERRPVSVRVLPGSRQALAPLCPAFQPGIRVAVARVEREGTGRFTARIVSHGNRGALLTALLGPDARRVRLTTEPDLPFGLGPGQTRIVRFRVDVPACPAPVPADAVQQISIEAQNRDGFVEVTGWPEDLTLQALRAAQERCQG